jgi:hypothetical protein
MPIGGVPTWLAHLDRGLPPLGWDVVVALAWGNKFHCPDNLLTFHALGNAG